MTNTVVIFRGENGFKTEINPKQDNADRTLTDWVEADTTIELKENAGGPVALTLTSSDFTFNATTNNIEIVFTDTHTGLLTKSRYYMYTHYRNNTNNLEEIGLSFLQIEEA